MKWFKKSSPELPGNQHNKIPQQKHYRIKKTQNVAQNGAQNVGESSASATMISNAKTMANSVRVSGPSKSCPSLKTFLKESMKTTSLINLPLNCIEILDPEEFFHDPVHVRNYKEEEDFLNMMSEWVIVENPNHINNLNYFSADLDEEFLQNNNEIINSHLSNQMTNDENLSKPLRRSKKKRKDKKGYEKEESAPQQQQQQQEQQSQPKEAFFIRLFSFNSIQMGIPLPKEEKTEKIDIFAPSASSPSSSSIGISSPSSSSATLFSLSGRSSLRKSTEDWNSLDKVQIKTEALASSIMGAIGKCPDKDSSTSSLFNHSKDNITYNDKDKDNDKLSKSVTNPSSKRSSYKCDHYAIKKFFHLDSSGNICLSINHIKEYQGWDLVIAHNKSLYKRYSKYCQCVDDYFQNHKTCLRIVLNLFQLLMIKLTPHPRNKINSYGSGPGDSLKNYTLQLAKDPESTFAQNIENFISCTKESREAAPQVVMRNMRQFMNGMKNYLVKHGEGRFHQELKQARTQLKDNEFLNMDAILETVMHQLVVLPLKEHLYGMFIDYYTRSGEIQLLAQNVKHACNRNPLDFGIHPSVTPPSASSLLTISNQLLRLQEAELPLEKLDQFLCVISTIYNATSCPTGQKLGADDFLPILVYVVAKCGFFCAEIEAEFMWGLLQPTLLNGEPGYYLTALCSAVHVLKSFMSSENESGTASLDWRSSSLPACSSVLRVIIPDECNGSLQTRTLPVRPHTTTREVCRIIAHKARITNPQDYALFKLEDGEETLLNDSECPQDIRFASKGKHCMLAYKRIDAKIAWPILPYSSQH